MLPEKLRILFVEDNKALLENLAEFFVATRYDVDFAADGLTALHLLATQDYDVIVLDVMLPGVSGITLCERLRRDLRKTTPVLLLTALDSIDDKQRGFGGGADDYLTKPFDIRELELRIQALARRSHPAPDQLRAGDVSYVPGSLTVSLEDGRRLVLSGLSATLFEGLMRAYPHFLGYEAISELLWGVSDKEEHTIRTHVYLLRKLLKKELGRSLIKGIYGRGYQLDPEQE